jgi:hypothetical protein
MMSSASMLLSSAHLYPVLQALMASWCRIVRTIGGVLDSYSFSLLSSSTLLIISSSVMICKFSSSPPASQFLMSAIVGPDEPFFREFSYCFLEIKS